MAYAPPFTARIEAKLRKNNGKETLSVVRESLVYLLIKYMFIDLYIVYLLRVHPISSYNIHFMSSFT